jgi:hypothetical protein
VWIILATHVKDLSLGPEKNPLPYLDGMWMVDATTGYTFQSSWQFGPVFLKGFSSDLRTYRA